MNRPGVVVARVVGSLLTLTGLAAYAFGEPGDLHHNTMHVVTGVAALAAGAGSPAVARRFCRITGAAYGAFGVVGFLAGEAATGFTLDLRVMHWATADHVVHLVLGSILLLGGLLPADPSRTGGRRARAPRPPMSAAGWTMVIGLVGAAVGVTVLLLDGVGFSTPVPPGLVILLVPAAAVAVDRRRWTAVLAGLAALFVVASYVPSGAAAQLFQPGRPGTAVGLWLQLVGSAVAAVAAAVAVVQVSSPGGAGRRSSARRPSTRAPCGRPG